MTHIDREDLALIALAEVELTDAEHQHLAECPECALELISLQHTVTVGKSARSVTLTEPADAVWGRIHDALGLGVAVAGTPRLGQYVPAERAANPGGSAPGDSASTDSASAGSVSAGPESAGPESAGPESAGPVSAGAAAAAASAASAASDGPDAASAPVGPPVSAAAPPAAPIELASRRRRRWLPVAVAAAIVGLVAGLGTGIWLDSLRQAATPPVIFEAQLAPFPGWQASGQAVVEKNADGHREVVVDLTGLTAPGATLREVWLIKADASGLISIGLLDGSSGHFDIPDTVDLAQYPLVDVSAEPDNGNPAHSGDSIVRGQLRAS